MEKSITIVTFNLRCIYHGDGINGFVHRSGMVTDKIRLSLPDVIALQEIIPETAEFFERNLPEYRLIYNGRDANYYGEGVGLLVRKSTFRILSSDFFWLSDTPFVPASTIEGAVCPRIAQCVVIQRKSDRRLFRILNTHLDCGAESIKEREIRMIIKYLKAENGKYVIPTFFMGDFNLLPQERAFALAVNNPDFPLTDLTADSGETFHGFGQMFVDDALREEECHGCMPRVCKIDYILADKESATAEYTTNKWTEEEDGIYLSDHYPLEVKINL